MLLDCLGGEDGEFDVRGVWGVEGASEEEAGGGVLGERGEGDRVVVALDWVDWFWVGCAHERSYVVGGVRDEEG